MVTREAQDSAGRAIRIGDTVSWRGQNYTIRSFGEPTGRFGTRVIEFEEPLHLTTEVPDEFAVDLVAPAPRTRCRWCDGDCPMWGPDTCPLRPRQIPRESMGDK